MSEYKPVRPVELRVKAKSLAAEARIIKAEEAKAKRIARKLEAAGKAAERQRQTFLSLQTHRKQDVRSEARSTHIARAFLSGLNYTQVEERRWDFPNWDRVESIVKKYTGGSNVAMEAFAKWQKQGEDAVVEIPIERELLALTK